MKNAHSSSSKDIGHSEEVETALLDVELFLKYNSHVRAIARLQEAIKNTPQAVKLREKLRELAFANNQPEEAARQCLALTTLYISRDNFDAAQERLLEAKQTDPRINIAPGLEAIRRARRPDSPPPAGSAAPNAPLAERRRVTFAGDLSVVSIFDAVQVIENARLTGTLTLTLTSAAPAVGHIRFNEGRIAAAAASGNERDTDALRRLVEMIGGEFDFERSTESYPASIQATSNTSLLLNALRELDEEKK